MDNGMELRVKDYCAFCPDFDADVDKVDITVLADRTQRALTTIRCRHAKSAKEYTGEYRRAEPMKQRWYKVVFETIERKPIRRTVTVCSTDSVHASALVYQQFGRKKIKVKSAKKVKESE